MNKIMAGHHEVAVPLPKAKTWSGKAGFAALVSLYMIGMILYFLLGSPALVDGQPITEKEVKERAAVLESMGQPVDEQQVLTYMVQQRVILKAAKDKGIRATRAEVNGEVQALSQMGLDVNSHRKALEEEIAFQIAAKEYFSRALMEEGFNPVPQSIGEQQLAFMFIQHKMGDLLNNSNIKFNGIAQ